MVAEVVVVVMEIVKKGLVVVGGMLVEEVI